MIFSDKGATHRTYLHPDALFGCSWCPTRRDVIATACKVSAALRDFVRAEPLTNVHTPHRSSSTYRMIPGVFFFSPPLPTVLPAVLSSCLGVISPPKKKPYLGRKRAQLALDLPPPRFPSSSICNATSPQNADWGPLVGSAEKNTEHCYVPQRKHGHVAQDRRGQRYQQGGNQNYIHNQLKVS